MLLATGVRKRRGGYRNGFYERDLTTQIGVVSAIRVPRARGWLTGSSVFSRYQRRQRKVNNAIRDVFLAGVSTRRVGEVLEAILGERISAQTVSRVAKSLDQEVAASHQARVSDDVRYRFWTASTCGSRRLQCGGSSFSVPMRSTFSVSAGCWTFVWPLRRARRNGRCS